MVHVGRRGPSQGSRTYGLNLEVLQALREAWELDTELWIRVTNPLGYREAHCAHGALVGGTSTVPEDRLGVLLAEEGRYDLDLLEPMAREAQAQGVRFGELLVRERLFTQQELAEALDRQATTRLQRMLTTPGLVTVGGGGRPACTPRPLGALTVELFRTRLAPADLGQLLGRLEGRRLRPAREPLALDPLALTAEERRFLGSHPVARRAAPVEAASLPEPSLRLVCALVGLGLLEPA